eukprot:GHVP01051373.1.p1 GENE.GHVP01051373.1~~GHVP01051373.1.p1  ORF type:complete len:226 (+),score=33.86 GHVP01051373.1:1771-2448(+)
MGSIRLGKVKFLHLWNNAFYILQSIIIEGLLIDTERTEIDHGMIDLMDSIKLGRIHHLEIINKAFYLLSKITINDGNTVEMVLIDTKGSEIDYEIIMGMQDIHLGKINDMGLLNNTFYLLPKIQTKDRDRIDQLVIDTKDAEIDHERVIGMGNLHLGKVQSINLYNKALYILSKIIPKNRDEIDLLAIDIKKSMIDPETMERTKRIISEKAKITKITKDGNPIQC